MDIPTIPDQMFLLIVLVIVAFVLIIIVFQWRKIAQSKNSIAILEKEIELKKMSMVEKDIESKRLMDNPIPLPQDQQDRLSEIRQSTTEPQFKSINSSVLSFLHSSTLASIHDHWKNRSLD